jgi:CHAT domain-containing protein
MATDPRSEILPRRTAWRSGVALAFLLVSLAVSPSARAQAEGRSYEELAVRVAVLAREARFAEALEVAEQFAAAARQRDGEQTMVYASAIAWVGHLYQRQGRLEEAQPLMERSLEIFRKVLPTGHPHIATATSNLGFQHQLAGRFEEAERLYKTALEMREKAEPPALEPIAESLNNLAQIYKRQSRHKDAIPLLRRAVEMREKAFGPQNRQVALSLRNLSSALELDMKFSDAEKDLRRALEILARLQQADHPELAETRNNLAQNLFKQRRYTEAEPLFREALRAFRLQKSGNIGGLLAVLTDLGRNLTEQGRLDEARQLLDEAQTHAAAALPPTHNAVARIHFVLSEIEARRGNATAALAAIRQASEVRLARRSTDEVSRLTYTNHVRVAWMAAAGAEPGGSISRRLIDEALVMAQRATQTETAIAVQSMTARFAARDSALQRRIRQREDRENEVRQLDTQLADLLALPREKRGNADRDLQARIDTHTKEIADIDAELRRSFPEYFTLVRPEPLDTTKVRSQLAPDEAMVVMVTTYDQTFVWALTREDMAWHRVDLTVDQLQDAVDAMRESLDVETLKASLRSKPKMFDLSLAHHIYQKLLGPVEGIIKDKKHLVMVPYGPLAKLPLQVLITGGPVLAMPEVKHLAMYQDAHWLARRHAISVLPVVGALEGLRVMARRPDSVQRPLIGFGNPRFGPVASADNRTSGNRRGAQPTRVASTAQPVRSFNSLWRGSQVNVEALRGLTPLPETEGELKTVARHLRASDRDLMFGAAATEAQVKRLDLTQYRIIYFATHGLVAGEISGLQEPALALTPPARASVEDDGLLTASEVAQLKLNADWVVLAACNTAAGQPGEDSEALSGLARAFFYAGARALLVSHWRVGSDAAAKLTTSTFEIQQSAGKIGRAEALQRAMLAYMADKSDPWAGYPAFWASFSLLGEGGASF